LFENTTTSGSSYNDKDSEEMVLLIPSFETVQGVKHTLEKREGINVEKREKDGSLVVVDSFDAYSYLPL
jgi:hypothetical protein